MRRGVIRSFNRSTGQGFIFDKNIIKNGNVRGKEIPFHVSNVHNNPSKIKEGEPVIFKLASGGGELYAYDIQLNSAKRKKPRCSSSKKTKHHRVEGKAHRVDTGYRRKETKHHRSDTGYRQSEIKHRQIDTRHWLKEETALMVAAKENDLPKLISLLASGVDKDAQQRKGQTALMFAASKGHSEIVRQLLNAGADMYLKTMYGDTAYTFAVHGKDKKCIELLKGIADISPKQPSNSSTNSHETIEIGIDEKHYTPQLREDSQGLGYMRRDHGEFGSFPKHDNYGEEGTPYENDNEFYDRVN